MNYHPTVHPQLTSPSWQMLRFQCMADASEALCEFVRLWPTYPVTELAYHLRVARGNLVVVSLGDPTEAELWLPTVAHVAGVPAKTMREQVESAVDWYKNFHRRLERDPETVKTELLSRLLGA